MVAVELVSLHEEEEDKAADLRRSDEHETVEPGALGVGLGGDDDDVEDRGHEAAHTLR